MDVEARFGGDPGVLRADVDDRTASLAGHPRPDRLGDVEGARDVDVQGVPELVRGHVLDSPAAARTGWLVDAGVVDQDPRLAVLPGDPLADRLDRRLITDVADLDR